MFRSAIRSFRANTLYSPTPALLERYLETSKPASTAYLFSSISAAEIQPLLAILQAFGQTVGSFSTPVAGQEPSLAIATFENATTFRTELSGRRRVQVGRQQRPDFLTSDDFKGSEIGEGTSVQSKEGWAGMWKPEADTLNIPELRGSKAKSFFLLTDGLPRPVVQGLDVMFPDANKLGLLTHPTPFLTGRPHTLLHNKEIYSSGTVGLAIEDDLQTEVDFNLDPLTQTFTVAKAQGNLLLQLEGGNGNPTQTLMAALQRRDAGNLTDKDEEMFLRIDDRMVRILSGDPSRGAISLDMEEALLPGQVVQFMHRKADSNRTEDASLVLTSLSKSDSESSASTGEPRILQGFIAASEGGFIHGKSTCNVPTATASWR